MDTTLDPTVVNLAKAIRQTESGGNFQAKGKSGEHGAYQFTPDTWNAVAPKYGINVPIEQATPEQQNAVAYNRIKAWKDAGHDVTQIASMWNAGEGEPNAYTGKFGADGPRHKAGDPSSGVNQFGARYDVPAYAKSVASAYLTLKNGGQVEADPENPSSTANTSPLETPPVPQKPGFAEDLASSIFNPQKEAGEKVAKTMSDFADNPNAGIGDAAQASLNVAGDIAGGVVKSIMAPVGKAINKVVDINSSYNPVVKALANSGVGGKVLDTINNASSDVQEEYAKFRENHPTVAKNIENAGNIAQLLTLFAGEKPVGDALEKGGVAVGDAVTDVKNALPKSTADVDAITETISPKETAAEARLAMKQGRLKAAEDPGIFTSGKAGEISPAENVKRAAETINTEIPGAAKMDSPTLFTAIDDKIGEIATNLRPEMEKAAVKPEAIEKLGSDLKQLQAKQLEDADADMEANVKKVQQKFQARIDGMKTDNLADIWDERIDYDNSVPANVKKANVNSPVSLQSQKTVWLQNRALLNDLINDAENGLGETSKGAFAKMKDMYTAQNGILTNAKDVLKAKPSKIVDWIKRNPKKAVVGGLLLGSQAPKATSAARAVIGGL